MIITRTSGCASGPRSVWLTVTVEQTARPGDTVLVISPGLDYLVLAVDSRSEVSQTWPERIEARSVGKDLLSAQTNRFMSSDFLPSHAMYQLSDEKYSFRNVSARPWKITRQISAPRCSRRPIEAEPREGCYTFLTRLDQYISVSHR